MMLTLLLKLWLLLWFKFMQKCSLVQKNVLNTSEIKQVYLVSRGTLLPSTQLSCSGTLSGGVVCRSVGDWPATRAGLPVEGVRCGSEFRDWPTRSLEPMDWVRAVIDGC